MNKLSCSIAQDERMPGIADPAPFTSGVTFFKGDKTKHFESRDQRPPLAWLADHDAMLKRQKSITVPTLPRGFWPVRRYR